MAGYIFTPISDVITLNDEGNYGSTLVFREITQDYNNSPYSVDNSIPVSFESAVKVGHYVYALSREASENLIANINGTKYPLNDLDGTTITKIETLPDDGEGKRFKVTLSHNLQAPAYGSQNPSGQDYFYFDKKFNSVNLAKIGFDKKPAQRVSSDVFLSDYASGEGLSDEFNNPLFTSEKKFFEESLKTINATSVVVNNNTDEVVKVQEAFPEVSQVSNSLLGIPRAEEQLSLFSDVSTLGLDESQWEFFSYNQPRRRVVNWEERASEFGNRFSAKMIENIDEQAIELAANPVPYSFPYNESDGIYYKAEQYKKYKNFIILGNLLYMYYEGSGSESDYLNPRFVRWGIVGNENLVNGQGEEAFYEVAMNGEGVSDTEAFRLIDKWTETWMAIDKGKSFLTTSFIDNTILNVNYNQELIGDLKQRYRTLGASQFGTTSIKYGRINNNLNAHFQGNTLVFSKLDADGTQPGYKQSDIQQVILQSKEVYRYQPGRISGFTFGTRVDVDPISEENYAEWGCVNNTDEYVFKLAGANLSIVRRSTVPLSNQSLSLSGGFSEDDQRVLENTRPIIGGDVRPKYYELEIPQTRWNGDALDGNGFTGYKIDPEKVTMWKIEFSWYGAIGVQFYGYIPVGQGEARWVKLHRIIIENTLTRANLQDPYFRMRYNLVIGDKSITTQPQFIYKYGSSVYIDGGDEGAKTIRSINSTQKNVPEDFDIPISVDSDDGYANDDNFVPMLALKNKSKILNPDGIETTNRVIGLPVDMTVSTDRLIEVDVLESEAGPDGFAFSYDNGLRWNPNCSPAIKGINNEPGFTLPYSHSNEGGTNLSPFSSLAIDFVFEKDSDGSRSVDKLALVKDEAIVCNGLSITKTPNKIPRKYAKLDVTTDSPFMIDESFDDAKIFAPGLNNLYIDWKATINDTNFSSFSHTSNLDGRVLVSQVRLKRKRATFSEDNDNLKIVWGDSPVDELFKDINSNIYFRKGKENLAFNWSGKFTLAEPRIPGYRHAFNTSEHTNSPSRQIISEFLYNFKLAYDENPANGEAPFTGTNNDITNSAIAKFPFRSLNNGLEIYRYVKRSAFKEYNNTNQGDGFCVPYSYACGRTLLQKANNAIATTDTFFQGKKIICRFLNPHASDVKLIGNRFTGGKLGRNEKYPQFQIGFTNREPAKKNMDGTTALPGENNQWAGTFESPGGIAGPLQDKDYIYVEYHASRNGSSSQVGESAEGEDHYRNAQKLQNDYRIKPILNESQGKTLGYHIGGSCSSVTLEVDPNFTAYSSLEYFSTWASFRNNFLGTGGGYPANTTNGDKLSFPEFPNAFDDGSYLPADFSDAGISGTDFYLVLKDSDGTFQEALQEGLEIKGGVIRVVHTSEGQTETFDTSVTIKSDPVRFRYYASESGTIDSAAYIAGLTQYGYVMQLSADLVGSGNPIHLNHAGNAITLGAESKLEFKIIKLNYPDGNNGTQELSKQKVFSGSTDKFWPVIKLREDSQINNINYKIIRPNQPDIVISPVWKTFGAAQVIKPITDSSPQGGVGELLDNDDSKPGGVSASIPESFGSTDRLSGIEFDGKTNKRMRKSLSNPRFVALTDDPAAKVTIATTGLVVYNKQGKLAEKAKKITSYYFGPEENTGSIQSVNIPLDSTFGEDRNKLLPDDLNIKSTFFRAQKVNLGDIASSANVRLAINISEL
jgi:hypothetical protein